MTPPSSSIVSVAAPAPDDDSLPAELRATVELFERQLAKVAFPEVDAASLRKQADDVRTEAKHVARAREALAAAIGARDARLAALADSAKRAVAYARIYSEARPDRQPLVEALAALGALNATTTSGTAPAAAAIASAIGKRRGRPPRVSAELFDGQGSPLTSSAAEGRRGSIDAAPGAPAAAAAIDAAI